MQNLEDIFSLFSELSIALAGFVGVVSAFAGRDRQYLPGDRSRVFGVAISAGSVFVGCLLFFSARSGGYAHAQASVAAALTSLIVTSAFGLPIIAAVWRNLGVAGAVWVVYVYSGATALALISFAYALISGGVAFPIILGYSIQLAMGFWIFIRLLVRDD